MITGQELNTAFARQVREMGLTVTDKMVTSIVAARSYYMLMAENEIYEAKTILLATGMAMSKTFPGGAKAPWPRSQLLRYLRRLFIQG